MAWVNHNRWNEVDDAKNRRDLHHCSSGRSHVRGHSLSMSPCRNSERMFWNDDYRIQEESYDQIDVEQSRSKYTIDTPLPTKLEDKHQKKRDDETNGDSSDMVADLLSRLYRFMSVALKEKEGPVNNLMDNEPAMQLLKKISEYGHPKTERVISVKTYSKDISDHSSFDDFKSMEPASYETSKNVVAFTLTKNRHRDEERREKRKRNDSLKCEVSAGSSNISNEMLKYKVTNYMEKESSKKKNCKCDCKAKAKKPKERNYNSPLEAHSDEKIGKKASSCYGCRKRPASANRCCSACKGCRRIHSDRSLKRKSHRRTESHKSGDDRSRNREEKKKTIENEDSVEFCEPSDDQKASKSTGKKHGKLYSEGDRPRRSRSQKEKGSSKRDKKEKLYGSDQDKKEYDFCEVDTDIKDPNVDGDKKAELYDGDESRRSRRKHSDRDRRGKIVQPEKEKTYNKDIEITDSFEDFCDPEYKDPKSKRKPNSDITKSGGDKKRDTKDRLDMPIGDSCDDEFYKQIIRDKKRHRISDHKLKEKNTKKIKDCESHRKDKHSDKKTKKEVTELDNVKTTEAYCKDESEQKLNKNDSRKHSTKDKESHGKTGKTYNKDHKSERDKCSTDENESKREPRRKSSKHHERPRISQLDRQDRKSEDINRKTETRSRRESERRNEEVRSTNRRDSEEQSHSKNKEAAKKIWQTDKLRGSSVEPTPPRTFSDKKYDRKSEHRGDSQSRRHSETGKSKFYAKTDGNRDTDAKKKPKLFNKDTDYYYGAFVTPQYPTMTDSYQEICKQYTNTVNDACRTEYDRDCRKIAREYLQCNVTTMPCATHQPACCGGYSWGNCYYQYPQCS